MYGPGAQSEEVLVFKPDGTGWMEDRNFVLCSAEFFYWDVTEPDQLTLTGYRRLEPDAANANLVEVPSLLKDLTLPFRIQTESTLSGKTTPVLRMPLWPNYHNEWNSYGFDGENLLRVREPQAGPTGWAKKAGSGGKA